MGEELDRPRRTADEMRAFMKRLLCDLRALERMLDEGWFETGTRRIGAEQEVFLVDSAWRPAPVAVEVLSRLQDPRFTTELGQFNLEYNLDPVVFEGGALRHLETQLVELLAQLSEAARESGAEAVLTGILPTIQLSDLSIENMTDTPRYHALNDALGRLRGTEYEFRIRGTDELNVNHDTVMLEAANTSFQVHFQVAPHEFVRLYNIAQVVVAPVLAVAVNSPLLLGKRLWRETRIALFQQSIDTRNASRHLREVMPRVSFGSQWVDDSVVEIFRDQIARFRLLFATELDEDPFQALDEGRPPSLKALRLHNGTVYRWNRVCYGISEGVPHLRIENRVLPAGPTPVDEVANAAFWFGLMSGIIKNVEDVRDEIAFDDAKTNFLAAARSGLQSQITWFGERTWPARELLAQELIPLAREGLAASGIDAIDIDRYLGVIEERVESGQTGAQWLLRSHAKLGASPVRSERLRALTRATILRQRTGDPVSRWPLARLDEAGGWRENFLRVEQYMTTELFTVNQDELVDLVANMMQWRRIRHVPVEDNQNRLVGLVSFRSMLPLIGEGLPEGEGVHVPVSRVMERDPVTISPELPTTEAIEMMRRTNVSCLLVVKEDRLVGLVTEHDFMRIAGHLLEEKLRE